MSNFSKSLLLAIAAASLSGCVSHGPDGVAYSRGDTGSVGVTSGSGSGSVSGSQGAAPEKEQRGNAPIGTDRDGHGPAAGAILDPTGAATRGKPY